MIHSVIDIRLSDRRQINAVKWYLRSKGIDLRGFDMEPDSTVPKDVSFW